MKWSKDNNFILNVDKTKELIVNFRKCKNVKDSMIINGNYVENAIIHKFLSLTVMNTLSWTQKADKKKWKTKVVLLRVLRSCNVNINVMINFYHTAIESTWTTNIIVRFSAQIRGKSRKLKIIRTAELILPSVQFNQSVRSVQLKEPRIS